MRIKIRLISIVTVILISLNISGKAQVYRTVTADFSDVNDFWPNIPEIGSVITDDKILSDYLWTKDGVEIYFPEQTLQTQYYAEYRYNAGNPFLEFHKSHQIIFRSLFDNLVRIEFVPLDSYFFSMTFNHGIWDRTTKTWTGDDPSRLELISTVLSSNTETTRIKKIIFTLSDHSYSSISQIDKENNSSITTFYTLQGTLLHHFPTSPGMYLKRIGNKTSKFIVP